MLPYLPMLWWQWDLLTIDIKRTGFTFTPPIEMARTLLLNHSRGFMPPAKWRDLSGDEIEQKLRELGEEIFNLRFQLSMGVAKNPSRLREATDSSRP